jgi:hypothetical protein
MNNLSIDFQRLASFLKTSRGVLESDCNNSFISLQNLIAFSL